MYGGPNSANIHAFLAEYRLGDLPISTQQTNSYYPVPLLDYDPTREFARQLALLPGCAYGPRFQSMLMDYIQRHLEHEAQYSAISGFFAPDKVVETPIFWRTFYQQDPYLYQFGVNSLPGLHQVNITIYVHKDRDGQFNRGRKYYGIFAYATAFDSQGTHIVGHGQDLCRGMLGFEWYNDKMLFTDDWDTMRFAEVLRLLRRAALRNFDNHGCVRTQEERLRVDKSLGMIFPARGLVDHRPLTDLSGSNVRFCIYFDGSG